MPYNAVLGSRRQNTHQEPLNASRTTRVRRGVHVPLDCSRTSSSCGVFAESMVSPVRSREARTEPLHVPQVSDIRTPEDPQASAFARFVELLTVVAEMETSNQWRRSLICFGGGPTQLFLGFFWPFVVLEASFFSPLDQPCCAFVCV